MRTRLVRAIAWRSIHSRHPRAQDGRLEYVARANEIVPVADSQTKTSPEGGQLDRGVALSWQGSRLDVATRRKRLRGNIDS